MTTPPSPEPDEDLMDECEVCGGTGLDGHECGEDTCICAAPEDNVPCDACRGMGFVR